jgi:hypothetical protein
MILFFYKRVKTKKINMSEFAPTTIELSKPNNITEMGDYQEHVLAKKNDESRYNDVEFAQEAAIHEQIQRDMISDARADVEYALAKNSPLVDKYRTKLQSAEVSLLVNGKETDKFYDRYYRQTEKRALSSTQDQDKLRLAA